MSEQPANPTIETKPAGASAAKAWMRALELTAKIDAAPTRTFPVVIEDLAERFADDAALLSDDESFTYRQLAERARRYARWALAQGLKPGEVVALMMPNRPEYMAVWLGLGRVGVVTALLNTHLTGAALAHAITVAAPRSLIVEASLAGAAAEALAQLEAPPTVWSHGDASTHDPRIDLVVDGLSADPLTAEERLPVVLADRALLIYTSGTTGLPKAAHVSHYRVMSAQNRPAENRSRSTTEPPAARMEPVATTPPTL